MKVQCINCQYFRPAKDYPLGRLGYCTEWMTKHWPLRERVCLKYREKDDG